MGKRQRGVNQYNFDGVLINTFDSPSEAEKITGLGRGTVSAVCNRKQLTAGSSVFRYVDDCEDVQEFIIEKREQISKSLGKKRPVYQYDIEGRYIREWPSVAEARRNIEHADNIVSVCSGSIKSSGGYVWSYEKCDKIFVRQRRKRIVKESLEEYCKKNNLTFLLEEWDVERNSLLPSEVSKKSNKKAAWVCKKGHRWEASIVSRVEGSGCQECKRQMNTSFPEQAIFYYVKKFYPSAINRYSDVEHLISEIDIYIPELRTGIEYDGKRWHQDVEKDLTKDLICKKVGIHLIRVREVGCPDYESTSTVVKTHSNEIDLGNSIKTVLGHLSKKGAGYNFDIDIERDYVKIATCIRKMEIRNSIQYQFPDIAKEWDVEKNLGILPSAIAAKSNKKYWWKCPKCGNTYRMLVTNRTRLGEGCPVCGQEKSRKAKIKVINQYDLQGKYLGSFLGAKEALKVTNLRYYQNINAVCERKQKSAGGFIWRYADDCDDI